MVYTTSILAVAAQMMAFASAFLAFQNPPWPGSYAMAQSTITMACNSSGWYNVTALGGRFGITSYDWSNAKAQWAVSRPMDCEERMVQQAAMTKLANPAVKVFGYRNLVKALPWFSTVRAKLADPAYSGFFLKFKPGGAFPNGSYHVPNCDDNYNPPLCSEFYHDQEQTPEVPSASNPNPDGACIGTCDCGSVPCGEYLFDHRNGTMLQNWLIQEVILGPNGLNNAALDGYFIDDFWCSNIINGTGSCTDPVQGPTEIDAHSQADMGLSDQDIAAITAGWLQTMTLAQQAILGVGGYTWSLMPGQDNANAYPSMAGPDAGSCMSFLRSSCPAAPAVSPWANAPLLFGVHAGNQSDPLPYIEQDVAAFLLARGSHAYMGWGQWGLSWPVGVAWSGNGGLVVPIPSWFSYNPGSPLDPVCRETSAGVFTRVFTNATVTLDCNTFQATFA